MIKLHDYLLCLSLGCLLLLFLKSVLFSMAELYDLAECKHAKKIAANFNGSQII